MASIRNELSHRTARDAKRHTSAIKKAKNASAGNNKQRAQGRACHIHGGGEAKAGPSSQKQRLRTRWSWMALKWFCWKIEPGIQPDALEPENDVDSDKVSPSEPNLDIDGEGDVPTPAPSPVAPPQSEPPEPQLSTRRFSRKRGGSKTHEDAPVRKSKKTEAAVAPEPSSSRKRRRNVKSEGGFRRLASPRMHHLWSTDCGAGQGAKNTVDSVVVEHEIFLLRAVPICDIRLVPYLGEVGITQSLKWVPALDLRRSISLHAVLGPLIDELAPFLP
ncbi:hypothetical protein B0H14DRAFT_2621425 [Mycena olivaceomarginata]|nr:hypothetical protein B0H14DRAFT_2621425 [Mycena olivaceomarginata]